MAQLPTEILCYIISGACTDDGQTGLALSLVSKHIRAVSRRYSLHSVALHGSEQLSRFAEHLKTLREEDKRVHHLYLTDRRRVWMEYSPGQDRDEWFRERTAEDLRVVNPLRQYSSEPIITIFQHIAATLRTLTLFLFDDHDVEVLTSPFPLMEELTLHGSLFAQHAEARKLQCPNLRRLHIVHDFTPRISVPRAISCVAPALTHLRISRMLPGSLGSGRIIQCLQRFLEPSTPNREGETPPNPSDAEEFPQTIRSIAIQLSQQRLYDSGGALRLLTSPMAYTLKDIAMRDERKRTFLLRPHLWTPLYSYTGRDSDVDFYMDIKRAWEQRNLGMESIWEVKQPDVLACYGYYAEDTAQS